MALTNRAGTPPDLTFRHLLAKSGLSSGEVELDYRFPGHVGLAEAVAAGETDLCILAEPYIARSIGANPEIVPLLDLSLEWNRVEGMMPAETAFLCRGDLAGERGQEVAEMVASLAESASLALKHPEYGVDAHRLHFNVVPAARAEGEIRSYLEIFFRNAPASIGGRIPDEKFRCQ